MKIKHVTDRDLENIALLNSLQEDFKLNDTENMIIERIILDGEEPIAYGIVKRMAEAIILTNPNYPKITRAKAMAELMQFAEFGAVREGITQLHCFVKDIKLARTLERKFGFVQTKDIVLVKNLD